jgi:hypothetical protein
MTATYASHIIFVCPLLRGCEPHRAARSGKTVEPVQHRRAQLMQRGERQLHLRFDARGVQNREPRRRIEQMLQQRALPDTRFAA